MELRKWVGVIVAQISSSTPVPTLERIAFRLRAEGFRISENELKQELSAMEDNGIVKGIKIDYTQVMIEWLLHQDQGVGVTCARCSKRSFISLYLQSSDDANYAKKRNIHTKVGSYCVKCGRNSVDTKIGLTNMLPGSTH